MFSKYNAYSNKKLCWIKKLINFFKIILFTFRFKNEVNKDVRMSQEMFAS